ncbi:MAG TPA: DUF72 domain-containing protein [Cellvibrio sp.]
MTINIGTSGWHYTHWKGDFYPSEMRAADYLEFYSQHFATVEVNNSFYRLPSEEALRSWAETVPEHFRFSVKASRFITHNKKLKDAPQSFGMFFERIKILSPRLGPILFQLPPRWKYNGERFEEFLQSLSNEFNYVFEFRNQDWMRDDAFSLLQKYKASYCVHDMPDSQSPILTTSNIAYVRFHGWAGTYGGSYSDSQLNDWAETLLKWQQQGFTSYVYFNNDLGGHAPRNAVTLYGLTHRR